MPRQSQECPVERANMYRRDPVANRLQVATTLLIAAFAAVAFASTANATDRLPTPRANVIVQQGDSGTSAYAYVGSPGNAGDGSIYEFAVAPNGSATPVAGSPLSGADGSIVGGGNYVFGTDGKNIVTYTIGSGGSLSQTSSVDGTAYDQDQQSATVQSLSLPPDRRDLYTDNWFVDGANNAYESWKAGSSGALSYLASSGLPLYSTAGGWPFTFTADGRFAYTWSVCRWDGSVWGFARNSNGVLTKINPEARGLPGGNGGTTSECSQGVAASAMGYVAVAWNGQYCCGGPTGFASYKVQTNGELTQVPGSVVVANESAMAFDPTGQYLAVALAGGVQMYQLQASGVLTPIGSVQESSIPFSNVAWDSSNHLYAVTNSYSQLCQNGNSACGLYIFNSNAGALTLAPGSPIAITQAGNLAVVPAS